MPFSTLSRQHALFATMCVIWGTTWIAVKVGVAAVPPVLFAGTRFVAAGVLLLAWRRLSGEGVTLDRNHLARIVAIALLMVTFTYAPLFWGMLHVSSGLAAVINLSLIPVALLAIGVGYGEESFSVRQAFTVTLGVLGLAVLFGPSAMAARSGSPMQLWGVAAIVAGTLAYCWGSVLARPLLRSHPPTLVAGAANLGGGLVLVAGSIALEPGAVEALSTGNWGAAAWASWAFLVLFGSLGAYTIYLRLLRDWGASHAGTYAFVSPVIAVLLGVAVFGERVRVTDAVGMAVMLAAAWLAVRRRPPTPEISRRRVPGATIAARGGTG